MPQDWAGAATRSRGSRGPGACCACALPSSAGLFVLAATMGLSFLLLILSGTIGGSWVPMINLIAVFFLPVYAVLSGQLADDGATSSATFFDEGKSIWRNFGACALGTVLVSMLGLPLILLHAGTLTGQAFGYWLGSTAVAVVGYGIYVRARGACAPGGAPPPPRVAHPLQPPPPRRPSSASARPAAERPQQAQKAARPGRSPPQPRGFPFHFSCVSKRDCVCFVFIPARS